VSGQLYDSRAIANLMLEEAHRSGRRLASLDKRLLHRGSKWLLFQCVCLAIFSSAAARAEERKSIELTLHSPVSVNAGLEEVRFGNTVYAIPRNYLASVTQARDGQLYASFSFQVLLPDFAPRTPQNAVQFDQVGWHDQLRVLFEFGVQVRRPEDLLAFYLRAAGKSPDVFQLVGSGYKFYQSDKTVPHEMFTKDTPHGLLFFTCEDTKYSIPSPSCTVMEPLGGNVSVIYHFSRKYMDKTAEIDGKLHTLLESFVKK
jgi:hypothetical protein